MKRPYKVRNLVTGRTRSFVSADAALGWVAVLGNLPATFQVQYVYVEDGVSYPITSMLETMHTIQKIYDLGCEFIRT